MKTRKISTLELSRFKKPEIPGNPGVAILMIWYVINTLLFRSSLVALMPSRVKIMVLRSFGAKVGAGVVIKPRVDIKYPWFLELGDNVWIGERVWFDNHTTVRVGSNTCISQGAYLFTGNHDWNSPEFTFYCKPIVIGSSVWVTAYSKIGPGSVIPDNVAVISN